MGLVFVLAVILAWRWEGVGGALAGFAATALMMFSVRQLEPSHAAIMVFAFAVPGLLWMVLDLSDQRAPRALAGHPSGLVAAPAGVAPAATDGDLAGFSTALAEQGADELDDAAVDADPGPGVACPNGLAGSERAGKGSSLWGSVSNLVQPRREAGPQAHLGR